ncbi:hypothetical protein CAEBREN_09096 [Caenorhabditis brenneri]|uniref:F-box domain-containing protein n=1 Tax=Caenorhabditis brenneri TaxID=135651 RepID=G0NSE1_CAEBE|nr:hypothetical protein CAEBREN_09096 [Caenorhabditis brenneri]
MTDMLKAYYKLQGSLGDDFMKYSDFEYWWRRFEKGLFDLNHDRRRDPKRYRLEDMTSKILERIFGNLEWKDRCAVRKTSRNMRDSIDASQQHFHRIMLIADTFETTLLIQDNKSKNFFRISYKASQFGILQIYVEERDKLKSVPKMSHWEAALQDFFLILKCPKLKIEELDLEFNDSVKGWKLTNFLNATKKYRSMQRPHIHLKSLKMQIKSPVEVQAILPFFVPGVLQQIDIRSCDSKFRFDIDRICDTSQWIQARDLRIGNVFCSPCFLNRLYHLKEFNVQVPRFSAREVYAMGNAIPAPPTPIFWWLQGPREFNAREVRDEMGLTGDETKSNGITLKFEGNYICFKRY